MAALLIALAVGLTSCSPTDAELRILSYNVHNLFDDVHDGTEFGGYRAGVDGWSTADFHAKAERTAAAIRLTAEATAVPDSATRWGARLLTATGFASSLWPDVLLLQEIENEHALAVLLGDHVGRAGYRWSLMPPPSGSAFRVAAATRFPIRSARTHALFFLDAPQRDILEVELEVEGVSLTLFVNHWPSRRGGVAESEPARLFSAATVSRRIGRLLAADPRAAAVVAGDLNMTPEELHAAGILPLFNGWELEGFPGSYHFRGEWSRIDQMLFTDGAVDGPFTLLDFEVISHPRLRDREGRPLPWRPGSSGGSSDHLPVQARLRLPNDARPAPTRRPPP